jgi:[ribosomal protein S5]-alanine N-acetyltransferase
MSIPVVARTERLELVAATLEHLDAELSGPDALGALLGVTVPASWPPGDYDEDALQYFIARLEEAGESAVGWYHWYGMDLGSDGEPKSLVASAGYRGPPAEDGVVEIGYSVVPEARRQGYATEMVEFLVRRAFLFHPVQRIIAHTLKTNSTSAGVLLRCGFIRVGTGTEPGTIRYQREHR